MAKIIKTFLILSFITATCWAYLLGEHLGTSMSARFNAATGSSSGMTGRSSSSGGSGGSGSTSAGISGLNTSGGAVDVSSIDLGFFSGGSSGDITAQSNSGTSGGTIDRTKPIDVSAYAEMCDGNIDKMIAAIKSDFSRTPTAEEYQSAANKISDENKISILSVAAVAELHSSWLTDYLKWTEGLTPEQKAETVSAKINEVAEEYGIPIPEARALLMNVDAEKAEQPGASSSLAERLNDLSIDDPLFIGAKENVLLQKAIAEAVPETSGSGEIIRPMPIMGPFERGDFEANESRAGTYQVRDSNGNLRYLTSAEAREVAIITHERSGQSDWLGGECPTLGGDFASIIQEVTGASPMDPYGSAAYEADISRFSNYYQISEDQAKQAINLFLGDSIVGDEWVQRDPETGEAKVDYLEVGPETGVGYPICPIMSNDIASYLNYVVGAGPRPEALAPEDIERITLGSKTTEIIVQNKAEELNNEVGTGISEEMMVLALGLAIVDKGLIITDENIREVISSITLNEVEYYISMINKVAKQYNLTPSEAASVLKMHIADQRINNPNYKLSKENDIIGSIEAVKDISGLYNIIKTIKGAKAGTVYSAKVDLNCDGKVNLADVGILLSFWCKNPSEADFCQSPDINQDGNVNLVDFGIIMSYWNYAFK